MRNVLALIVLVALTAAAAWVLYPRLGGPEGGAAQPAPTPAVAFLEPTPRGWPLGVDCWAAVNGHNAPCPELGLPPSEACRRAYAAAVPSPECPPLEADHPPPVCVADTLRFRGGAWWSDRFMRPIAGFRGYLDDPAIPPEWKANPGEITIDC